MSNDLFWPADAGHDSGRDPGDTMPLPGSAGWGGGGTDALTSADRSRRPWRAPALAAGLAALVFGGVGVGVGAEVAGGSGNNTTTSDAGLTVAPAAAHAAADPRSLAGVAAKVLPAVVSINVQVQGGGDTGSGVILRQDGYILTNNHVISAAIGGGATVTVTFNDGTTAPATIVGGDAEDDLAVIKVNKTGLPVAVLGSASSVKVGDPVLAIGSPLGLQGTVTSGIVSSVNRPVQTSDSGQQQDPFGGGGQASPTTVIDAIQTDAAINPGNSGGPLVDTAGEVIGINSAIASTGSSFGGQSGNIGVGFAIPVDQAKVVAQELIQTGKATHPLLGVSLADATDSNGTSLARVQSVLAGGPAEKAGIKAGDIIVAVGDQKTAGAQAAIAAIRSHQPGQRVDITVLRGTAQKTFSVTLVDASTAQG